jgi:predicted nucleic acid-binding protein
MKRVLIDTNVVLDVLLERKPHLAASAAVWDAVETGGAADYLATHAITTTYYRPGPRWNPYDLGRSRSSR